VNIFRIHPSHTGVGLLQVLLNFLDLPPDGFGKFNGEKGSNQLKPSIILKGC